MQQQILKIMGHTNKPILRALENRKGTPRQSRGNPQATP